jgi:hypothetical protein
MRIPIMEARGTNERQKTGPVDGLPFEGRAGEERIGPVDD